MLIIQRNASWKWLITSDVWGTAVAQWLTYYATTRKAAGSIPDGVIGIFH